MPTHNFDNHNLVETRNKAPSPGWKIPRRIAGFLFLSLLFALVYTQFPLYSSNQNQYFLHGLATSGYGFLQKDWLANTADPTPVFSALVWLTESVFHTNIPFYFYYALLMGVYLYASLSIAAGVFNLRRTKSGIFLLLVLLLLAHSALLRFGFSRLIGAEWPYILEGGVAGQRILGTVLEPSVFGVFLTLSIALFLRKKPLMAVLSAVLAATIHPTYLLSAAALTAAYLWIMVSDAIHVPPQERPAEIRRLLLTGAAAFISVLPILGYVYLNFAAMPSASTTQAQDILAHYRIPHHAVVSAWFDTTTITQLCIVALGLFLVRKTRLFPIVLISTLTAIALTLTQIALNSDSLALIFPWRISIYIVPLASVAILGRIVAWLVERPALQKDTIPNALRLAGGMLVAGLLLAGIARSYLDFSNQRKQPERPMMAFVESIRASDQVFLIPVKMENFRLVTGAPVFIDDKSIPYRADDVLEWYRRNLVAKDFYRNPNCDTLGSLRVEGITHIVMPKNGSLDGCPNVEMLYRDDFYIVYSIVPGADPSE